MKLSGTFAIILLLLYPYNSFSQQPIEQYHDQKDSLQIGPDNFLPYNPKGYTLFLPGKNTLIRGVLISLDDQPFNKADSGAFIHPHATANGFAVLYVSTGVPLDLYFSTKTMIDTDSLILSVFSKYQLARNNIFFLGVNLSGHRALKYINYSKNKKGGTQLNIRGVVLCDGVLDWVRQWYEEAKAVRDNFAESSVFEGRLVTYLLEKNLGGNPKNNLQIYLEFSTYSYFDEEHKYFPNYKDLAVRAYTEPSTQYWMNVKGKSVFDTNFPDMVGFITELKLKGNKKGELVVFNQERSHEIRRNPNATWQLVNKKELMEWVVKQVP